MPEAKVQPPRSLAEFVRLGPAVWIATGLGIGFMPKAPGTWGTLWGLPLVWGLQQIENPAWRALAIVAICIAGVPICTAAVRRLGNIKDPGCVVFDEIAAMPITFFLIPESARPPMHWGWLALIGFGLFRFFDVTKLPPIRKLEKLPDGLGVMADDWLAGVYANLAFWGVLAIWSRLGQ